MKGEEPTTSRKINTNKKENEEKHHKKKNLCLIPSDSLRDRFLASICRPPLIKAAHRAVMRRKRLIKASQARLTCVTQEYARGFTTMFSDTSSRILNLPPCKSYSSHRRPLPWQEHAGSWILPWSHFNLAKGVTRIPRRSASGADWEEPITFGPKNVNRGGESERRQRSVPSRQLDLVWTDANWFTSLVSH